MTTFNTIDPVRIQSGGRPIRIGFVPLNDCAPLLVARELGFFSARGLDVRLSRELGWASVRDKLAHGELDAAHAPCGLPLALTAGVGSPVTEVICPVMLSLGGNAITLSEELWKCGVRDGATFKSFVAANRDRRTITFGIVSPYSTHSFLLRRWLTSCGVDYTKDVRITVVPPPQMPANLAAGHLDGYCSGEPWNSAAVARGDGWVVATSPELVPFHPEKVLVCQADMASRRGHELRLLIGALVEACEWCDNPANTLGLAEILSERRALHQPAELILRGLPGRFDYGHGRRVGQPDLVVFHRESANEPSPDKAGWIARSLGDELIRQGMATSSLSRIFRADLYQQALQPMSLPVTPLPGFIAVPNARGALMPV
jgi:ABC-type nitrate/sulfonate/bicarbonate transport system substrate-binding protein